jgi:hypothetical protein
VSRQVLVAAARHAYDIAQHLDWKSHDAFDVLLSPYVQRARAASPLAARVLVQIGRRSGSRVRRLLKVPRHEEPKALADFLRAAVMLAQSGEEWAGSYVADLSARSATPASSNYTSRPRLGTRVPLCVAFRKHRAEDAEHLYDDGRLPRFPRQV